MSTPLDRAPIDPKPIDPRPDPEPVKRGETLLIAAPVGDNRVVTIIKVSASGIEKIADVRNAYNYGWLDERTLVAYNDFGGGEIRRIVDGKVVETIELVKLDAEFLSTLLFTKRGEVWVGSCDPDNQMTRSVLRTDLGCQHPKYVRVFPSPSKPQSTPPPGTVPDRATNWASGSAPKQSLPTSSAPRGVTLSRAPVTLWNEGAEPPFEVLGVTCETQGSRSTWPRSFKDQFGNRITPEVSDGYHEWLQITTRWIRERPPLFEVRHHTRLPTGDEHDDRYYFRACQPEPYDAMIALGGTIWAEFDYAPRSTGPLCDPCPSGTNNSMWTLWNGETKLGTLVAGEAIRVNQQ